MPETICPAPCQRCGQSLEATAFRKRSRTCIACADGKVSQRQGAARAARRPHGRFVQSRWKAQHLGRLWTLTWEEYSTLLEQPCFYCGGALNDTGSGLDRKDPLGGYTAENVVPCCWVCNYVKANIFTTAEMIGVGAALARVREQRGAPWPKRRGWIA